MRRVGVMIGSDTDLPQCIPGLEYLIQKEKEGIIKLTWEDTSSEHRNPKNTWNRIKEYAEQPWETRVNALIVGAGSANVLSGSTDAKLRNWWDELTIKVYAVAFESSLLNTLAAVLGIIQTPGHNMIFRNYIGQSGFLRACMDTVNDDNLLPIKTATKEAIRRSFPDALKAAYELKKSKGVPASVADEVLMIIEGIKAKDARRLRNH